ncbi:MAG: EscU/YscU/HrcU family type III secretion system export apparatus switch protein [Pseudomonadota bacterium]
MSGGRGGEDGGQERSLPATERKREEARRKGDLPRAQDAQTATAYIGLAVALALGARDGAAAAGASLTAILEAPGALGARAMAGDPALWSRLAVDMGRAVAPILFLPALLLIAYLVATRSVVVAPDRVMPKLSRISPIENAGQKYGLHGLGEFVKSSAKLGLLLLVFAVVLLGLADWMAGSVQVEARLLPRLMEVPLRQILTGTLGVALLVGLADFFWQRHQHEQRLRMSPEEMKRELRETEGDPMLKARRRERAEEIATNRMIEKVPDAAVVITNPTHVAIALSWTRGGASAPVCVAKGADEIAARIRERAEAAGVPIHQDPPTARALFATTPIGAEIEPAQYRAVAAAILFAEDLRAKRRGQA